MIKFYETHTKNPNNAKFVGKTHLGLVFCETKEQGFETFKKWEDSAKGRNKVITTKYG